MRSVCTIAFCLIIVLLQPGNSHAQGDFITLGKDQADSLRIQANRMANALVSMDSATLIKYSYPGIIDRFFDGEKNVGATMREAGNDAKARGFRIISIKAGNYSKCAVAQNEIYTFIDIHSITTIKEDTLKAASFYLAISKDRGLNWYFIDESLLGEEDIKTLFPGYNGLVPVPAWKEPVYIKKKVAGK